MSVVAVAPMSTSDSLTARLRVRRRGKPRQQPLPTRVTLSRSFLKTHGSSSTFQILRRPSGSVTWSSPCPVVAAALTSTSDSLTAHLRVHRHGKPRRRPLRTQVTLSRCLLETHGSSPTRQTIRRRAGSVTWSSPCSSLLPHRRPLPTPSRLVFVSVVTVYEGKTINNSEPKMPVNRKCQ